jgi:cytochrome b subunit of formate dehydrogenase
VTRYVLFTLLLAALLVSGVGLIVGSSSFGPAKAAHVGAAYLSIILVLGHLYMALVNPGTRPALSGMISGRVDRAWLRSHHARAAEEEQL